MDDDSVIRCELCQSTAIEIVDTKIRHDQAGTLKVYGCADCGVQFLHPMGSDKDLAEYYNGDYRKEYVTNNYYSPKQMDDFFQNNLPEAKRRAARVEEWLRPSDEIVEIGCASGYFLTAISPKVQKACGTEWDKSNSDYAAANGFEIRRNVADYGRQFDKIFMFHVLEHIKEPVEFLRELQSAVKPGGMIFVEVPNREDILLSTYRSRAFSDFYYQTAHLWYFNRSSLEYVAREAGYEVNIQPLQRYDFSNHIHWLSRGIPGGQGMYSDLFPDSCNQEYVKCLQNAWKTDTLFCVLTAK